MIAEAIANGLIAYAGAGFVFALAFVLSGAGRLDPAAARSGTAFRLMIFAGAAVLWPLLLRRWISADRGER
jgi:hypothetical protein